MSKPKRQEATKMNVNVNEAQETEENVAAVDVADAAATADVSTTDGAAAAAPATVEDDKVDERFKMVKHAKTGALVKRKDYILELWQSDKMSRGDIAKHLSTITGKKVAYQIVFAATKKIPGGPDKVAEAAAAPAETPAETSPAADEAQ